MKPSGSPAFVLVKTRRDELPDLVEHERHCEHNAEIKAEVDHQADIARWTGVVQLVIEVV